MIITKEGKRNLEIKLSELKEKLAALEKEKAYAYTATGDTWHDNPYFDMLRRDEEALVKDIKEREDFLHNAEVLEDVKSGSKGVVNIGSKIRCIIEYSFDDEKEETILEIVGHGESDLMKGKIAYDSPAGKNLTGHMLGDVVTFEVPAGTASYRILEFI